MNNKSFTLIELLVVIVIIGILAGVIMISTSSSIDKANITKAKVFAESVRNELLLSLVSEWTFDNSSNYGEDSWGSSHGTIYGTPLPEENCASGKCLNFDDSEDYIATTLKYNNLHSFTLEAWIRPTSSGEFRPIVGTLLGNNGRSMLMLNYYKIKFNDYDNGIYSNTDVITLNKWQHIVAAYNNSNVKLYHNGLKVGEGNYTKVDSVDIAIIGRVSEASYFVDRCFVGTIDDVRVYNTALSSSQIKQNYIAGLDSLLSNGNISKEDYNNRITELAYEK